MARSNKHRKLDGEGDVIVGQRIKLKRNELGLSQEALGAKVGVTFQQIQKYENGSNHVKLPRLTRLAEALETALAYFIDTDTGKARPMTEFELFVSSKEGSDLIKTVMVLPRKRLMRVLRFARDEADDE